jgi:hypothetical protein
MWRSLEWRRLSDVTGSSARCARAFRGLLPATPSLAQAPGYVRVKLVKAGLMVGAGGGSGVLTHRGRTIRSEYQVSAWVLRVEHRSACWKDGRQA